MLPQRPPAYCRRPIHLNGLNSSKKFSAPSPTRDLKIMNMIAKMNVKSNIKNAPFIKKKKYNL